MNFVPDRDIPDLSGKVIIVTGGNIGLGLETVRELSKHNPSRIYLAARSKTKADAAIAELKRDLPDFASAVHFLELDLASFDSIKTAVTKFNAEADRLDLLVNNAGIMGAPPATTKEGYEITFGTNHVGHALLTKLLLPKMKQTAAQGRDADVRIINLSSIAYKAAPKQVYTFPKLQTTMTEIGFWPRYGLTKLANIHYTQELAKRNPGIMCVAVHPGSVKTNLASSLVKSYPWLGWPVKLITSVITVSVQRGALNQLWAATAKGPKSGSYYNPVGIEGSDSRINDPQVAEELWNWTEAQFKDI